MVLPLDIIIVEKSGNLKILSVKDFKEEELFKKCGFKKDGDFLRHASWNIKIDGIKYIANVYGKLNGKANSENKYEFPPPIDNTLFFGSTAIVLKSYNNNTKQYSYINMTLNLWNKIYEKLYGGFEDLNLTAKEDENEIDELEFIPKKYKTKQGYLKDGFVVDDKNITYDNEDTENMDIYDNNYTDDDDYNDDNDDYNEDDDNKLVSKSKIFKKKKEMGKKSLKQSETQYEKTTHNEENFIIENVEIDNELVEEEYDYE